MLVMTDIFLKQSEHDTYGRSTFSLLAFKFSVLLASLAFAELLTWRHMADVKAQETVGNCRIIL